MLIVIIKIFVLSAIPVNILLRSKIAIEKFGLSQYRSMPGANLFTKVSWRDTNKRVTASALLFLDIFILCGTVAIAADFIFM